MFTSFFQERIYLSFLRLTVLDTVKLHDKEYNRNIDPSFLQGGTISYLVEWLDIEKADDREIDRRHRTIALEDTGIGGRPSMAISGEFCSSILRRLIIQIKHF